MFKMANPKKLAIKVKLVSKILYESTLQKDFILKFCPMFLPCNLYPSQNIISNKLFHSLVMLYVYVNKIITRYIFLFSIFFMHILCSYLTLGITKDSSV